MFCPLRKHCLFATPDSLADTHCEGDMAWIVTVVESLEKDGLAVVYEQRPPGYRAEAVAETRPAYGTEREVKGGGPARFPDGEIRVRLP